MNTLYLSYGRADTVICTGRFPPKNALCANTFQTHSSASPFTRNSFCSHELLFSTLWISLILQIQKTTLPILGSFKSIRWTKFKKKMFKRISKFNEERNLFPLFSIASLHLPSVESTICNFYKKISQASLAQFI